MKIDLGTLRLAGVLSGPIKVSLEAGEFLRVEPGETVRVRCESGRLWITHKNRGQTPISADPGIAEEIGVCPRFLDDVWLRDGDSATLDSRRQALIEAVDLTTLSIGRAPAL